MTSYPLTSRQHFPKQKQRRQSIVFASTGAVMLALALISLLVLIGLAPMLFVNDFSRGMKYAIPGMIPCPVEGVTPVDPSIIQVRVLSTTSHQGLASGATTLFANVDYEPLEPSNASPEYTGVVQIDVDPAAVDKTHAAARLSPKSKVVPGKSIDKTAMALLGTFYNFSPVSDEVGRIVESKDSLKGPSGCLPSSEESLKKAGQATA